MTNSPSSPIVRRALAPLPATLALAVCALFAFSANAGAEVLTTVTPTVGRSPRVGAITPGIRTGQEAVTKSYANPEGHPVLHGFGSYAIYWDPTDHYHGDWQRLIDTYLGDVAAQSGSLASVFAVDAQYTDKTNVPAVYSDVFHGAYTDTNAYPASGCKDAEPFEAEDLIGAGATEVCLTSAQIAAQLESFVAQQGLPRGMNTVYYLMTPPAVTVCLDAGGPTGHCSDYKTASEESYKNSFCSYHAAINPGGLATGDGNTIVYGVIPWTAGGFGDYHLTPLDRKPGWECQDGGWDPTPKEHLEGAHEKNSEEKTKFNEMDLEEKAAAEEAEELEGPHQQEPNQQPCPNPDGSCDTGLADLVINQLSLQQQNIVTDPLLNAWQDSAHGENTDECRFFFAPIQGGSDVAIPESKAGTLFNQEIHGGNYYLNDAFNLAASRLPYPGVPCMSGVVLEPYFTAPSTVNAGETVGFNGMESDITLDAAINYPGAGAAASNYATYTWSFGDGTSAKGYAPGAPVCQAAWLSPCAASAFHAYTYGGKYKVTLTVNDVGGNEASVSHEVAVVGPPPPSPSPVTGGGASSPNPGAVALIVDPVAAAAVLSRSLKTALRHGLAVRYSVNEQVAGRFEVMIPLWLAHRLKLRGSRVAGLPAGTPPQLMIARAVLVTTRAGHATIHIRFSKAVAARLRRARRVPLLLRLFVRNAAAKSPARTTVISSATLAR